MPVWTVSLSDLEKKLNVPDRRNCFVESNPRYCLNLVQAAARWANDSGKGVGYPTYNIHNDAMEVMAGHWTEQSGGDPHNTYQDLSVDDLLAFGMDDPTDFSSVGILKWARATNRMADKGRIDNGACAFITGESTDSSRGSQALRTMRGANANSFYQAIGGDVGHDQLSSADPDFERLGWRFDIWTRAVYRLVFPLRIRPQTVVDWAFPNYEVSPEGKCGIYTVMSMTLQAQKG